jgi:hypothetical protein
MSRLDELTLKLADGVLTEEERRELEGLLVQDPAAARSHAAMLDVVAELRGKAPAPDLVAKTMNRIQERISERIKIGVLGRIHSRRSVTSRRFQRGGAGPRRWRSPWAIILAVATFAALALLTVLVSVRREKNRPEDEARSESRPVLDSTLQAKPPEPSDVSPEVPAKEKPSQPVAAPRISEGPPSRKPAPPESKPEPAPVPDQGKPEPVLPPVPEAPKPPSPTKASVVVAILEKAENASILAGPMKTPAKSGQELLEGEGLDAEGPVTVSWPDGTRLELLAKTQLRELSNKNGKMVVVVSGILVAQVAAQPADRPMLIQTPQAEVRVLGTAFRLSVDPSGDATTQVDVTEGKVRVKRNADGKSVDVTRGNQVIIGKSVSPLSVQPRTGLLLHWKLDEAEGTAVLDTSGNQFHATLQGEASRVPARQGVALRLGPAASLRSHGFQAPELFTVSAWIYMPKLNAEQDWFMNLGGEFVLMREGNMERRQVRTGFDGKPQELLQVASVIQAGQWTHLAATFDGAEVRLYSNGGSVGSRKATRRLLHGELSLGPMSAGSEATIDDVRVYDRPLSAADISRVMQGLPPSPAPRR